MESRLRTRFAITYLKDMFSLEAQHCKESRDALVDDESIEDLKKIPSLLLFVNCLFSCHNKTSKLGNFILHQFEGLHKLWDSPVNSL